MQEKENISDRIVSTGKELAKSHPKLKPYMKFAKKIFSNNTQTKLPAPRFSGWGMTTFHELPWIDEYDGEVYRKADDYVRNNFSFDKERTGIDLKIYDTLQWRHWIVSTVVRYVLIFSKAKFYNFVECGVSDGFSAFFALREIVNSKKVGNNYKMHLYDAWSQMNNEQLLEREMEFGADKYSKLDINITKKHLSEFKDNTVFHLGYIPSSLDAKPESPDSIVYMHIDLNSAKATEYTLNYFFPRLVSGGVILFDDYGWMDFSDTKKVVDKFFHDKSGLLFKSPTGQAFFVRS